MQHSYEKFRFAGDVNKPPFEEIYTKVKAYIKDILPKEKKQLKYNMRKQPMGIYLIGCFISVFTHRTLEEKYEPRLKTADISRDFLAKLPKTEVKIPNPTFRVFIIGRKVLNYCGNFGSEE